MADRRLTVLGHVDEFRKRLTYIVVSVLIAGAVGYFYADFVLEIMVARLRPEFNLVYKSIMEPFMVRFKLGFIGGLIVSTPVIFYQVLAFLAPALKGREKRVLYPMVLVMVVLFGMGASLGYFYVMPVAWTWLYTQGADLGIIQILSASDFINFVTLFLLAFGVAFETPLVLAALMKLKIVSHKTLRKNWRIAYVVMLIVAAIATPDWSLPPMLILGGSMIALYESTLLVTRWW
ncbi:MAG: twin-arginine translocase subunit TatC [Actinomycetia bacterium]|nr:twin-arginine translocase subunit TatC [Actinomycetes bacterium]